MLLNPMYALATFLVMVLFYYVVKIRWIQKTLVVLAICLTLLVFIDSIVGVLDMYDITNFDLNTGLRA